MSDLSEGLVDVVLVGGPDDIPADARVQRVAGTSTKVKITHRNGYEHFERDLSAPETFRWTMQTLMAE